MFLEYFDLKRPGWDADALAALLTRLQESGYQSLTLDAHAVVARYGQMPGEFALPPAIAAAGTFADVLIPPAQRQARLVLARQGADTLRAVVLGRSQHEVRMSATAAKMHLEAVLGGRIGDMMVDENGRAGLVRFRAEALPALHLAGNGRSGVEVRNPAAAQLLISLRRQPQVHQKATVLASQVAALAPDRPADQTREQLEQLVGDGILDRWHVVVCRESGQWLAFSPTAEEARSFLALHLNCPHCGRSVGEEQVDTAYRLGTEVEAYLSDNRWICDLVETSLRKMGVESVAFHPGAGAADGAAWYYGSVLLFRATDAAPTAADVDALDAAAAALEAQGWHVDALGVSNTPAPPETRGRVTVIGGLSTLDTVFEDILADSRRRLLASLLPAQLQPVVVPLAALLPAS
ncbi:MAG TPA: hypothetical protein VGR24_01210 [bacterium]|jgi:hypothetical protein|nr:hypothetical protein [bacterium]